MQTVISKSLKDTMYYNGMPVFVYRINYPSFTSCNNSAAVQTVNEYYFNNARHMEEYCRTLLFAQTLKNVQYIQDNHRLFDSYSLIMDYQISYNSGCIVSLFMDTYTYMGGAHGETKRQSDTWDFKTGTKIVLDDIYPLNQASLTKLQRNIEQKISVRLSAMPGSYFDDFPVLLQKSFRPENFYIKSNGIVIYFQQYDIAPYSTGIPEFLLPLRLGS